MRRLSTFLLIFIGLLLTIGCTNKNDITTISSTLTTSTTTTLPTCYIDVPYYQQINNTYCGPAVMQMVLGYYNVTLDQEYIADKVSTDNITNSSNICNFFSNYTWSNYMFKVQCASNVTMEKIEEIVCNESRPVIVLQRLAINDEVYGHYRVVVGADNDYMYVIDPLFGLNKTRKEDFLMLWRKNNATLSDNWSILPQRFSI